MADIQYKWGIDGKGSVQLANNLELPQFKVTKHRQMSKVEALSTGKSTILLVWTRLLLFSLNCLSLDCFAGNYSRLVCEIEFVRSMGYYLIQIYIPASLIVIISWVSFWLHRVSNFLPFFFSFHSFLPLICELLLPLQENLSLLLFM